MRPARLRAPARQLAVARHRVDEEDRAPQHDAHGDLHHQLAVQAEDRETRGHGQRDPPPAPTRVRPAEGQDERQQVERERQHPQERHGRHLLREVARHRPEHHRREEREREPEQASSLRGTVRVCRRPSRADSPGSQAARARPSPAGGLLGLTTAAPRDARGVDRERRRPQPALRPHGGPRLDEERVARRARRASRRSTARRARRATGRAAAARTRPAAGGSWRRARRTAGRSSMPSRTRIAAIGASGDRGFAHSPGVIGDGQAKARQRSSASAAAIRARCASRWRRGESRSARRCAHA